MATTSLYTTSLKTSQLVWFGFTLIILNSLPITFYTIQKLGSVTQQLDQIINSNNKKTSYIQELENVIRDRAITLVQMNSTDDPFELDDYKTQMSDYASVFLSTIEQLNLLELTQKERQALNKVLFVTRIRAPEQLITIELFLQNQKKNAYKNYYNKVIPGLTEVLEQLNLIKSIQTKSSQAQLDETLLLHQNTTTLIYTLSSLSIFIIIIIVVLITKQIHRIEKEKFQAQQILESSHTQIQELIDHATDGILSINEQQEIILFNPEAENLFGYKAEDVMGKEMTMLIPEYARANHLKYVLGFRDSARDIHAVNQSNRTLILKGLRKNGEIFPAEVGISKHFKNNSWSFTAYIRDITEQQNIEKALTESAELANRANQVKTEFLANMSHELRTPMHAILSFSSLGSKKLLPQPFDEKNCSKLLRYFNNINESGTRLLELLNNLLDLSKLESGKTQVFFQQSDLEKVVKLCINETHSLISDKEIDLIFHQPDVNTRLIFDTTTIHQVIINFLSNAIKFSDRGGKIEVSLLNKSQISDSRLYHKVKDQSLILKIEDEGIGIPENELEQVFDHFVQSSKTATGAGGTGLGLSISQQIILAHQGEIWAEHREGNQQGSIFYFSLPLDLKHSSLENG